MSASVNVKTSSMMDKILFFGALSFIIEGVTNLIPIRSTMVRPLLFSKLMISSLVVIFVCICSVGVIVPLALGEDTPELVMMAFQSDHMWTITINLFFIIVNSSTAALRMN